MARETLLPSTGPVGATILVHGTPQQQAQFLPGKPAGHDVAAVAFSEPAYGSDLAGVETCGEVLGNELVVTGHKTWVARADQARAIFVLCRTEPAAPRYHNLACVVLPLPDPRITLQPVRQMTGTSDLFEVVLDGARAPLSHIVGGRGNGWRVAMTTLAFVRGGPGDRLMAAEREFWELVECARAHGRDRDPVVRQQLAWAGSQLQLLRIHSLRRPSLSASLTNVLWSEYHRRLGELAMDIAGADGLLRPGAEGYATSRWQQVFLSSRGETLAAGTSEVQRTTIAEQLLGLPKEA